MVKLYNACFWKFLPYTVSQKNRANFGKLSFRQAQTNLGNFG